MGGGGAVPVARVVDRAGRLYAYGADLVRIFPNGFTLTLISGLLKVRPPISIDGPAEAITAATINAAHAIGRERDVGSLESGKLADLLILDIPSWRHLGYRMGGNAVETVVKRGRVFDRRRLPE